MASFGETFKSRNKAFLKNLKGCYVEKELDRVPVALKTDPGALSRNKKEGGGAQKCFNFLLGGGMTEACSSSASKSLCDVKSLLLLVSIS